MLNASGVFSKIVCLIVAGSAVSSLVQAKEVLIAAEEVIGDDGYNKTYNDPSKSFKDRMKETREKPQIIVSNDGGGLFLGVHGAFGPVYNAEPGSSSGMGFSFGVEPGYVIQGDSWSRFELGIQVAMNSFDWKETGSLKATMSPLTILPRVGFGHSLGNNLFGVFKLGFGLAMGGQLTTKSSGVSCKTDSATGSLFSGDYDVVYGADKIQFTGGVGATHHKYSWSSSTCNGDKKDSDVVTNINFVNLHGGVRIQF